MKKTKKGLFSFVMIIGIILFLAGCGSSNDDSNQNDGNASSSDEIVMRIATGSNESHAHVKGFEKLKEILEEESDGRFKVEIFHSGALGGDREMIESVQVGSLESAVTSIGSLASFSKEFEIFNFPFLFPSKEVADSVLDGPMGQEILDGLTESNMIGLNFWEQGYNHLTNNKRPVENMEDLQGLKIRTIGNDIQLDTINELGANATPMEFTELFTALQQGAVDGQQNNIELVHSNKFYEVQKYMTLTGHVYGPSAMLISTSFYESLSEDDQEMLRNAANTARDEARKLIRESEEEKLEELKEFGMEVTELDPDFEQAMIEKVQPVIEKYRQEIGEEFVDQMYEEIENSK